MNERKWWVLGLAGAIMIPVLLIAINFWLDRTILGGHPWRELDALFISFAAMFGIMGVSVLPIWPMLRFVLVLLYIPLSFAALNSAAACLQIS